MNLYCKPCREEFTQLTELLSIYPEKVSLAIRFNLSGKDYGRKVTSTQYLLQYWKVRIHGKDDESIKSLKMLEDWFKWMDLEQFKKSYPLPSDDIEEQIISLEQEHIKWVADAGISRTPSVYINGRFITRNYTVRDLIVLAPELYYYFLENLPTREKLQDA